MAEPSDRALVQRTRRGQEEAYGQLVERYQTSVLNVCYRLMGERQAAEDQAQEAFLRAYRRLETFQIERPFGPWIRRVAANLCLNVLKASGPVKLPLDEERDLPGERTWTDPEIRRQQSERSQAVHGALQTLPPHYRAVIELRHYQELSYKEIGQTLNWTLNEVRTNLYRARQAMAELLEGLDV